MNQPDTLGDACSALWADVTEKFDLDPDGAALLEQCCRTADELARLSEAARVAEPMVEGSKRQPVINPIFEEVRRHRITLARLLRELALPDADEPAKSPQAEWRSARARKAAETRWDMHRRLA